MIVGIDLGTTNSLVACMEAGRARVLTNSDGERMTPSAVHVAQDGTVLIGAAARARHHSDPDRTATSFKRDIGTPRTRKLGDRTFTPIELSALVLAQLRQDATAALGMPIHEAVVTVPAWFREAERRATKDAATIAGLTVPLLLNEPTAAAIAYGFDERAADARIAVVDLGGGTFDVTILEIIEGLVEIRATAGEAILGGDDFTEALCGLIREEVLRIDPNAMLPALSTSRIWAAAESAKKRLGTQPTARIDLPELVFGSAAADIALEIDRARAQQRYLPLLTRLRTPMSRALRDAGFDKVDVVLPVGGAARMQPFLDVAAEVFRVPPMRRLDPDTAIAEGAALRAGRLSGEAAVDDLVVSDITGHSLGVATARQLHGFLLQNEFSPIIERGTPLPTSREAPYALMGRDKVVIRIYEGDHSDCTRNTHVSTVDFEAAGANPGDQLLIRLSYDASGLLEIDARIPSVDATINAVVERAPGALTAQQIADARAALQKLKIHPRELLPNATTLARADALYLELRGRERMQLGQMIGDFKMALESQDPDLDEIRKRFNAMLDVWTRGRP